MGWKLALPTFEFSSPCEWVVWGPRKQKDDLRREGRVFGVLFHWLSCFGEGTVAPVGRVSRPPLQDSMSKETWEGWLRLAALYTSAGLQQSPLKKKRNWWNSWSLSNTGTFTLCQKQCGATEPRENHPPNHKTRRELLQHYLQKTVYTQQN